MIVKVYIQETKWDKYLTLSMLDKKFQQKTFWNIFSYFSLKIGFKIHAKCLIRRCQKPFSGKNKKNINLLFAYHVVKVDNIVCWKFYPAC